MVRMVFLTIEKWPSDLNYKIKMKFLTTENSSMGFFVSVLWGLAKVNESKC